MTVFNDNWYPESQLTELCALLNGVLVGGHSGDIVEIGCWEGKSTIALARCLNPWDRMYAVDTWKGNIEEGPDHPTVTAVAQRDVYSTFVWNLQAGGVEPRVFVRRMDGREFLLEPNRRIAFLHIDADHTYNVTKALIELAKPQMASGGIICGDDYQDAAGVQQAVDELLPNRQVSRNLWWSQR